jgi:hypothetical protein
MLKPLQIGGSYVIFYFGNVFGSKENEQIKSNMFGHQNPKSEGIVVSYIVLIILLFILF